MGYRYSPKRVWWIFTFIITIFLLIKRKESFLLLKPLSPELLRVRITLLGASFIKLAQVLATRADFFDDIYLNELKSLHDEIPPMPKWQFKEVFKEAFKDSNPFVEFNTTPIASASIGQVHKAILKDGSIVAVKLRRYGIVEQVKADIKILNLFNRLFSPLFSIYTKNSVEAVVSEFSDMILKEVSLSNELGNLKSFSKTYTDSGVLFPTPYEEYCSDGAIVMSFESGVRFDDKEALRRLNIDFYSIMGKLIEFYTKQMLIKGYFHADPHPGNLLIRDDGTLVLLDFGMVKLISDSARVAIIEMVKSANEEDFELYISSCKRLGVIAYEAPQDKMMELAQKMFSIFNDESLDAMSMQELAFGVMASMRDFPFKLPQEAVYILRVSAIIEGLGTTYISNFNGIKDILPILQNNIPKALGIDKGLLQIAKDETSALPLRIKQLHTSLRKISEDELRVHINERQIEWLENKIVSSNKRDKVTLLVIFISFFILLAYPEYKEFATVLFGIGAVRLIFG